MEKRGTWKIITTFKLFEENIELKTRKKQAN